MGFLQLIDCEDSINIKFLQPRYSIPTSEKCKAYLFAEFISYLHNRHQNSIIAISVLNFKNIFLNKPSTKDFFLNISIKRCVNVKEFSHLLERKILSSESPYKKYDFDKKFSPKIKEGLEYIEVLYSPKTSSNPYYKKDFCMLAILMSDFIRKEFYDYVENIQILNL